MTTNVTVRVPPHVHAVLISFEKFTAEGWTADGSQLVLAGSVYDFCIHDTRRLCSMQELQVDPAYGDQRLTRDTPAQERLNTINEHAHGDDHHEHHRSHGGLSNG